MPIPPDSLPKTDPTQWPVKGLLAWVIGIIASFTIFTSGVKVFLFTGLKDWIQQEIWNRIFRKRAQRTQGERERAVTNGEFDAFKETTAARFDELGRVTHAAAVDVSDVAAELRRSLERLDSSNDQHLLEMHVKINETRESVARLQQRTEDLPDVIIGKLTEKGLLK